MNSNEVFETIELWPRVSRVLSLEELTKGKYPEKETQLMGFCYKIAEEANQGKVRDDKEAAFLHPLNVSHYLVLAQVDFLTVCAGLWHDLLEEERDTYLGKMPGISDSQILSRLEVNLKNKLEGQLIYLGFDFSSSKIIDSIWLLTRHKKHRYYKSIAEIFNYLEEEIRERAMEVKLADRIHNIQTIGIYPEEEQIFQCFKNIFILNNTKRYLMEKEEEGKKNPAIEKLFKKCGKATYERLFRMAQDFLKEPLIFEEAVYLNLALKKYVHEKGGLWQVTDRKLQEGGHPSILYDGIVKKYNHRLHKDQERFEEITRQEFEYCKRTFGRLQLDNKLIWKGMDYKDTITLMEVVGRLIYKEDYYIKGFECSELCSRGRVCEKEGEVNQKSGP